MNFQNLYPTNPGYVYTTSQLVEVTPQMREYEYKKNVDLRTGLTYQNVKYQQEIKKMEFKAALDERRLEGIERRRKNRDNASLTIGEDSDGHLRLNTTYPNGAIEVSMPILSGSHYRMIQFCGMESKRKLLEVSWDEMQEPIILNGQAGAREFGQKMLRFGNVFLVGHDRKREVLELVFGFLCEHAQMQKIGDHYGWNEDETGWVWIEDEMESLDGLLRRFICVER